MDDGHNSLQRLFCVRSQRISISKPFCSNEWPSLPPFLVDANPIANLPIFQRRFGLFRNHSKWEKAEGQKKSRIRDQEGAEAHPFRYNLSTSAPYAGGHFLRTSSSPLRRRPGWRRTPTDLGRRWQRKLVEASRRW
ncbi:hypothetical protein HPP92_011522 [Vanilla planifolia]|uniref:Uncharacterized protein n=1 Tax=Vanilla planifolia TaxID=51239 RepID=A0A835RBM7_VANPL|nr:hypothetical protein HPP92_011522 [Vanilla planifolia]